jgi:hypothetical protein
VYTFRLSIGDTNTDTFNESGQNVTAWILFVLCALATNIIMLNLLIALISDTFASINSNSMSANYQERARLISENSYLIPTGKLIELDRNHSRYIVVADETPQVQSIFTEDQEDERGEKGLEENKETIKEDNKNMEERFMGEVQQIKDMIEKIANKK